MKITPKLRKFDRKIGDEIQFEIGVNSKKILPKSDKIDQKFHSFKCNLKLGFHFNQPIQNLVKITQKLAEKLVSKVSLKSGYIQKLVIQNENCGIFHTNSEKRSKARQQSTEESVRDPPEIPSG